MLKLNGYRIGSPFDGDAYRIASTGENEYIPLICLDSLKNNMLIPQKVYLYQRPETKFRNSISNSSKMLVEALNGREKINKCLTSSSGEPYPIFVGKGYIENEKRELLLVVTIKKEAAIKRCLGDFVEFEAKDAIVFMSTQMFTDPLLATFYRRLQKEYLAICYQKGLEVRILSPQEIEKNTFSSGFKLEFTTISELDRHLTQDVATLLRETIVTPTEDLLRSDFNTIRIPAFQGDTSRILSIPSEYALPSVYVPLEPTGYVPLATDAFFMAEGNLSSPGIELIDDEVEVQAVIQEEVIHETTRGEDTVLSSW